MIQPRNYNQLPPIVTGYPLDDVWSVVVPIARTNLVINPSLETNTTGWTAIGGSIARVTTFQYHGAYSLAITPTAATTDGARFDTVSLVSGTTYAYSCKVLGIAGKSYKLAIETTAGVELHSKTFVASGRWQWIWGYYTETSTTTRRVTIRKAGGTDTALFYLDGVQVEAAGAGETVSTYLDGSQQGLVPNQYPPAYLWTGTPHASTSSRSGLTRAGGMVIPFKQFGFFLLAIVGLGLATPQNVGVDYARIDGSFDDYTRKPSRQFTLAGQFETLGGYRSLREQRGGLSRLLDRDLVAQDQQLVLLRHVEDECGEIATTTCRVLAKYMGGLDGNTDNQAASSAPITFLNYLPVVLGDGEAGTALGVQTSVSNANFIIQRTPAGVWQSLGTGLSGATAGPGQIVKDTNGNVYVAGDFTSAGGVANTNGIAMWNGTAWTALGTGVAGGSVLSLALDAQNRLYVGGSFTSAGGVANTAKIARWTGSAWQSIATSGANGNVNGLVVAPNGTVYAAGPFTTIGGTAAAGIAQYNGTSWAVLAASGTAGGDVVNMVADAASNIYAVGTFTSMGGVANTLRIAKWNGTAWSALGTGLVGGLAAAPSIDARGILYVGGDITSAGGVSVNRLAQWNGVAWSPVDGGVTAVGSPQVSSTSVGPDGNLYLSGIFTNAGALGGLDSVAIWNGATFVPLDIDLPGGVGPLAGVIRAFADGSLYIGFNQSGSVIGSTTTTITNTGTARSYPVLTLTGPTSGSSRIYQLRNVTTGRAIYLNNYIMQAGETATFVFQPDNLSFTSTFQGNIAGQILPGSNPADFFVQPGANTLAFFAADSSVVATLAYRPAFVSLDNVP